jgi:hypothetical protein
MNRNRPKPEDYAPYHTLPAFDEGIAGYMSGRFKNPMTASRAKASTRKHGTEAANTQRASCATATITNHGRNGSRSIT